MNNNSNGGRLGNLVEIIVAMVAISFLIASHPIIGIVIGIILLAVVSIKVYHWRKMKNLEARQLERETKIAEIK